MVLSKIIASLLSDVSGGETGQSPQMDAGWLANILPSVRAEWIEKDYLQQQSPRRLNPYCYQRVYLKFNPQLQVSAPQGAVIFHCPKFISLDNSDGIRYAGSLGNQDSGLPFSNRICINQWKRVYDRGELANYQQRRFTSFENNQDYVFFLYQNNDQLIEVYNCPSLTEGMIEGVLDDPLKATNFNPATDDYPIDINSLDAIRNYIYREKTSIAKATPPDDLFDVSKNQNIRPPYPKLPVQQPQ